MREDEEEAGALAMCVWSPLPSLFSGVVLTDVWDRGDFADMLGEDYLGLRELGIAAEFGMSSLSIPKRLLKGKKGKGVVAAYGTRPLPHSSCWRRQRWRVVEAVLTKSIRQAGRDAVRPAPPLPFAVSRLSGPMLGLVGPSVPELAGPNVPVPSVQVCLHLLGRVCLRLGQMCLRFGLKTALKAAIADALVVGEATNEADGINLTNGLMAAKTALASVQMYVLSFYVEWRS
jgi:hypothetical protein